MLVAEASADWERYAIPIVLEQDLAASQCLIALLAQNNSAAYQLEGDEVLRTNVDWRAGRFSIEAILTDLATQKNQRVVSAQGPHLITVLNGLAKQIDSDAIEFSTRNERALEAFALAVASPNVQSKVQGVEAAIAADASFGLAYIVLAETLSNENGPQLKAALDQGQAHVQSFTNLDKARFELIRSQLMHAPVAEQIGAANAVVKVTPNNSEALALLGSNLFLAGKGKDGERFMRRAISLSPQNANLRDQLAVGLIETGQFRQAEKVLNTLAANQAILPQLAFCILLEGDEKRANDAFEKFVKSVPNPDAKLLLRASWQALTGRVDGAVGEIVKAQFQDPRVAAAAKAQAVVWQLLAKHYDAAKQTATGSNPVAVLLAEGPAAETWRSNLDAITDSRAKELLRAYALFLHGMYAEAGDAWRHVEQESGGADPRARTMLAASLRLASKQEEAKKIPVQPFLPDLSDYYNAVSFNELRTLLGQTP